MAKHNAKTRRRKGAGWLVLLIVLSVVGAPLHAQETDSVGVIAFVSDMDGDNDIYLVNADGSHLRNLTINDAIDFSPSWSPDGNQIAFHSNRDGTTDIFVMYADGSEAQNLTNSPCYETSPVWSPNGLDIAFFTICYQNIDEEIGEKLAIMTHDGNNIRTVARILYPYVYGPEWSPDSKQLIVFSEWYGNGVPSGPGYQTVLFDLGEEQATYLDYYTRNPQWSPDGKQIMFGDCDLLVMDANAENVELIHVDYNFSANPEEMLCLSPGGWSPDGKRIAFSVYFRGSDENPHAGLYIMDVDGTNVRKLTDEQIVYSIAWSPDGQQIAYGSEWQIYVVDVESREITPITSGLSGKHNYPAWQPQPVLMENN